MCVPEQIYQRELQCQGVSGHTCVTVRAFLGSSSHGSVNHSAIWQSQVAMISRPVTARSTQYMSHAKNERQGIFLLLLRLNRVPKIPRRGWSRHVPVGKIILRYTPPGKSRGARYAPLSSEKVYKDRAGLLRRVVVISRAPVIDVACHFSFPTHPHQK